MAEMKHTAGTWFWCGDSLMADRTEGHHSEHVMFITKLGELSITKGDRAIIAAAPESVLLAAHYHVAGTTVGLPIDTCASCGLDLRHVIHSDAANLDARDFRRAHQDHISKATSHNRKDGRE